LENIMGKREAADAAGIGVVGAGKIAAAYHLPAIAAVQGVRLVAVADVVPGRASDVAGQFGFAEAYIDWRRVIDRPDVDAILLLTQYEARREVIPAAAAAGKHIFTQKPLAASVAEGEELAAVVRRAGVRLARRRPGHAARHRGRLPLRGDRRRRGRGRRRQNWRVNPPQTQRPSVPPVPLQASPGFTRPVGRQCRYAHTLAHVRRGGGDGRIKSMAVDAQVQFDKGRLADLCRRHGVATLSLFGSAARGELRADSDLDVLVEFEPGTRASYLTLGELQQDLSDVFGRHVDLKTPTTLSEYIRERMVTSAEPIYVRR
jgi:predicted nucleotidyltransferase